MIIIIHKKTRSKVMCLLSSLRFFTLLHIFSRMHCKYNKHAENIERIIFWTSSQAKSEAVAEKTVITIISQIPPYLLYCLVSFLCKRVLLLLLSQSSTTTHFPPRHLVIISTYTCTQTHKNLIAFKFLFAWVAVVSCVCARIYHFSNLLHAFCLWMRLIL